MSLISEVFESMVDDKLSRVQQGFMATIEKYDQDTMRADVKPLLKRKPNGDDAPYPVLSDLPVMFLKCGGYVIRPVYESGDLVWCAAATYPYRTQIKKEVEEESPLTFNLGSACVMGGIAEEGYTLPTNMSSKDGLLIGNDELLLQIDGDTIRAENSSGFYELSSSGQFNANDNLTVDP